MDAETAFAPFQDLAATLLAATVDAASGPGDGAHDHAHLLRVWHNAFAIAAIEGAATRG